MYVKFYPYFSILILHIHTSSYVSIRHHVSVYVIIRPYTYGTFVNFPLFNRTTKIGTVDDVRLGYIMEG